MKDPQNKSNGKRSLLLWLLLILLAVCFAVLLFLYGQQNNYTLLQQNPSLIESTTVSQEGSEEEEKDRSSSNSSRRQSSRTSSRRTSSDEDRPAETSSSFSTESLPDVMGQTPTPILSSGGANSSSPSSTASSDASPPVSSPESEITNQQYYFGLTIQWDTDLPPALAQLWADYAEEQRLFQVLESSGFPVTVHLSSSAGTDAVFWENGFHIQCYAGTEDQSQIHWDTALLLEEVLRQQGRWEESAEEFQQQNPNRFNYGSPSEMYVGFYFCSLDSQQNLEQDRLEVWQLVLQSSKPSYGGLLGKYNCLMEEYQRILAV